MMETFSQSIGGLLSSLKKSEFTQERGSAMKVTQVFSSDFSSVIECPLFISEVPAGFPSPADDYIEKKLDLNKHLIRHPAATYFVKVSGDSMVEAGIRSKDLLIVDRALEPADKNVVVAVVNGELTVKRFRKIQEKVYLVPDNPDYSPLSIDENMNFEIWGVVTYVIHAL
jgi:DNA polymerase V